MSVALKQLQSQKYEATIIKYNKNGPYRRNRKSTHCSSLRALLAIIYCRFSAVIFAILNDERLFALRNYEIEFTTSFIASIIC